MPTNFPLISSTDPHSLVADTQQRDFTISPSNLILSVLAFAVFYPTKLLDNFFSGAESSARITRLSVIITICVINSQFRLKPPKNPPSQTQTHQTVANNAICLQPSHDLQQVLSEKGDLVCFSPVPCPPPSPFRLNSKWRRNEEKN